MKRITKVLVSIISLAVLGIFSAGCGSNNVKITKEQQDNIVKELSRSYDIKSIEFKKIEKTYEAGSITLYIKINDDSEYETTISIDNMDELNNIKTRWGLSPIQRFEKIKRNERLPLESVDMRSIKIKYIQE
jgi:hypothetical protein